MLLKSTYELRLEYELDILREERSLIKEEMDNLKILNAYYPVSKLCGRLSTIKRKMENCKRNLRRVRGLSV